MAQFEAEIRLYDLSEEDVVAARRALEEKLRQAGFQRWRIVDIGPPHAAVRARRPRPPAMPRSQAFAGSRHDAGQSAWVFIAAVAWATWFVWLLSG